MDSEDIILLSYGFHLLSIKLCYFVGNPAFLSSDFNSYSVSLVFFTHISDFLFYVFEHINMLLNILTRYLSCGLKCESFNIVFGV